VIGDEALDARGAAQHRDACPDRQQRSACKRAEHVEDVVIAARGPFTGTMSARRSRVPRHGNPPTRRMSTTRSPRCQLVASALRAPGPAYASGCGGAVRAQVGDRGSRRAARSWPAAAAHTRRRALPAEAVRVARPPRRAPAPAQPRGLARARGRARAPRLSPSCGPGASTGGRTGRCARPPWTSDRDGRLAAWACSRADPGRAARRSRRVDGQARERHRGAP
jgi:hypothetical protein